MPEDTYQTREVLAAAYPDKKLRGPMLTHTVRLIGGGDGDWEVLCRRVKSQNIADSHANPKGIGQPPTCGMCLRRDPRFNASET